MAGSTIASKIFATATVSAAGYASPPTVTASGWIAPAAYSADGVDSVAVGASLTNQGSITAAIGQSSTTASAGDGGSTLGGQGGIEHWHASAGGDGVRLAAGGYVANSGTIHGGNGGYGGFGASLSGWATQWRSAATPAC